MKTWIDARWVGALVLAAAVVAAPADAEADPSKTIAPVAAPVVAIYAAPIFGPDANSGTGWSEVVARVENLRSGEGEVGLNPANKPRTIAFFSQRPACSHLHLYDYCTHRQT